MSDTHDVRSYEYLRELYLTLDAETREKLGVMGLNHCFVMYSQLLDALKKVGKHGDSHGP